MIVQRMVYLMVGLVHETDHGNPKRNVTIQGIGYMLVAVGALQARA